MQHETGQPTRKSPVPVPPDSLLDIFSDSPVGVYVVSEGKISLANDYFRQLLSYPDNKLIGRELTDFVHQEDQALIKKALDEITTRPPRIPYSYRLINRTGVIVGVKGTFTPSINQGNPTVTGFFMNITQELQLKEASERSEEWFSKAFRASPDPITITSLEEGRFIEVNDAFLRIHGYQPSEVIGHEAAELRFWPHPRQRQKLVRMLRTHRAVHNFEMEFRTKSGEIRSGLLSAELMTLAGEPCIISVIKDVTEAKRAEKALRESEEFNSSLLDNSPNPILVVNPRGSIRYVNPALENITGYTAAELTGLKPPYPWWGDEKKNGPQDDLPGPRFQDVRRTEECYVSRSGREFWVESYTVARKSRGRVKFYISNWVDITESRQRRENMQFYISEVTRAQEAERQRIAHELHDETIQRLASLYIDIEKILALKDNLSPEAVRRLCETRNKIDVGLDEVRRFSHELRPGLLDRFGLIPALELHTREITKEGDLECNFEVIGAERRLLAETDLALFRVAQEALRNIKRHAAATEATVSLVFSRDRVKLVVTDNGQGFQLAGQMSNLVRTGKLGLIGMAERARLLNGKFSFESELGKGTTITLEVIQPRAFRP